MSSAWIVPGMLRDIAAVVAKRGGNIVYTQLFVVERGVNQGKASVYMEIDGPAEEATGMVDDLKAMNRAYSNRQARPTGPH